MLLNKYILRDLIFLLGLLAFPMLSDHFTLFKMFDEGIFLLMSIIIFLRIISLHYQFTGFDILFISYLLYSLFLITYNHLPLSHIMQILITSKFILIYLYFNSMPEEYKAKLFHAIIKMLTILFILSVMISILQFILPSQFHGYSNDGRGILGITAKGIFMSRTLYPEFLLMFIIIIFSYKKPIISIIRYQYYLFLLSFILIFLTFARKELVLLILLVPFLFYDKIDQKSKPLLFSTMIIFIVLAIFAFIIIFAEINASTFTDKQVRYHIYQYTMEVFNYYFPFGSGPGTFGSIMSVNYQDIYEKFSVSKQITGYNGQRGVIFDLFLVSLLAEYGLGWIFFILFLITMTWNKDNPYLNPYINLFKLRLLLFIVLLSIGIFVPILLNWVGFMIITILALISDKGKYSLPRKSKLEVENRYRILNK